MINRRLFLCSALGAISLPSLTKITHASFGTDYKLTPKVATASLLEDRNLKTEVWAYDGLVPGPVIRAKKGEEVSIEVFNQLEQPTTIHWHGIRIDNAMDGVAGLTQEPIPPGESFVYRFTPQDAGTYWYHPHNRTWEQLARGLYGSLIVEGDATKVTYDRDYTVLADDWRLEEAGLLHEASFESMHDLSHAGRLGNILTLNGKPYEQLSVTPGERVRLRFINTANARIMQFNIAGHEPWLIALDGQPVSPQKLDINGIQLAPAQRADLVIDVIGKSGDKIEILETSGSGNLIAGHLVCNDETAVERNGNEPELVNNSVPIPDLKSGTEVELLMTGGAMRFLTSGIYKDQQLDGRTLAQKHKQLWAFNGIAGMPEKPFFVANSGETIKLKVVNDTVWPHSIHLHGHHFKVISRESSANKLSPQHLLEKDAYRDTVLLERDETVEIAFVADNVGKWMLHCHMLEHQASGMGTWFKVI